MRPAALTEEEGELEDLIWQSGHVCADCGEELHLLDEIILLQVGYPLFQDRLYFCAAEADTGEYEYEPFFFHLSCFEELTSDIELDDPEEDNEGQSIVACCVCQSHIRAWEMSGIAQLGELRMSQRMPNGEPTMFFEPISKLQVMCMACLVLLNEDHIQMWDDFCGTGPCDGGRRCWRSLCAGDCRRT